MKKVTVFTIALMFSLCQITYSQIICVSYTPNDAGVGLRYDQQFNHWGIYGSASYGNGYLYKQAGISDHVKISAGISVRTSDYAYITAGVNWHSQPDYCDLKKLSFEIGTFIKVFDRTFIGVRTDILRWEPGIDLGFKFVL